MKNRLQTISLDWNQTKVITFGILLILIAVVPSIVHFQWITGPMVNAILIIAAITIGPMEAIMLGLMPSTVALATGLLPLPLAPMIPFIMIGNAIMIMTFYYMKDNFWAGITIAALFKFAFLHGSVLLVMSKLLDGKIVSKLAVMMSWPQFATAIIGGVIAYFILKGIKKYDQ